jgi:hypothetical protein
VNAQRNIAVILLAGMALAGGACADETEAPAGDPADCTLIANRCHRYDKISELGHQCHEVGHEGADPVACTEMKGRCLAECPQTDGGSGGSAGTGGSGGAATGGSGGSAGGSSDGSAGAETGGSSGHAGGGTGGAPDGSTAGCNTLADLCHGIDAGFAIHCHELGHDGNETACAAELAACLAECTDGS